MGNSSISQIIQLMLASGLMISACGLLLLGMNNKYFLIVNRIRLLNEERRKFLSQSAGKEFTYEENVRVESISIQLSALLVLVKLVRNAVLSYTIAVAFFVFTSLLKGLQLAFKGIDFTTTVTLCFLSGIVSVVTGIFYAAYETKKGYDIIQLEINID